MEEDIVYFKRQYIIACRVGNKKRAAILKSRLIQLEDALVIYHLPPSRRTFKIDVGALPHGKAEKYIKELRDKFRKRNTL
jgi:hypothetical protein